MSLKTKFQYVYTIGSVIILTALVSGVLLSIKGMSMLTDTLDNNDKALKLYKAVTKERNALKLYFEDGEEIDKKVFKKLQRLRKIEKITNSKNKKGE